MNINFTYANMSMIKAFGPGPATLFGWVALVCNLPSGTCTASYDTMAEDFGVTRKTIQTWMNKLHDNGYVERKRVEGQTYDITIPEGVRVSLEFNIKKPRKKAQVPEAIAVIHGLYGNRYPKKETWPRLIEKCLGATPEHIAYVHGIWCAQKTKKGTGYSPTNPAWLEWVENGIPSHIVCTSPVEYKVKPAQRVITDVDADDFIPQDDGGTF